MVRILSIYLFTVLAAPMSCKHDPAPVVEMPQQEAANQTAANAQTITAPDPADTVQEQVYTDSFMVKMDSLRDVNVTLPPVYYHDIYEANENAKQKFDVMASATDGDMKMVVNTNMLTREIISTINSKGSDNADLLLLIDVTLSMTDDITDVKRGVFQIVETLKKYKGVRLAVGLYGDKNFDSTWFQFKNFEMDYDAALRYINNIELMNGVDIPESVYDAFFKCMEQGFWKSKTKRNIILIGDAPPQEKPMSDYSMPDVIKATQRSEIKMNFYPIVIIPAVEKVKIPNEELARYKEGSVNVTLSPNPATDEIVLGFDSSDRYYIEIYDMAGRERYSKSFFGVRWQWNVQYLDNGMYILRITNGKKEYQVIKFIVKR